MILSLFVALLAWLFVWIPEWAVFIPAIIEGAALTPLLVFSGLGRGVLSKLHYWYGAIIAGRVAYFLRSDGAEFAPVDEDGTVHLRDGRTVQLDLERTKWYRLGNRPLALLWDKDDDELVKRFANLTAMEIDTEAADIGVVTEPQAGVYGYTPKPAAATTEQKVGAADPDVLLDGGQEMPDPYLLDGGKIAKRMHGGDDTGLAEDALNKAIKDHGGDTTMGERMMLISGVIALLGGAGTSLLYFGLIV